MKILLSIKPEFVKKIFSGEKKYEFRKVGFKNENVQKVIIYASRPISKVVGEFSIEEIIRDNPEIIWKRTRNYSGIDEKKFKDYFEGRVTGYAIKVKNTEEYSKPISLREIGIKNAPQSFLYLK